MLLDAKSDDEGEEQHSAKGSDKDEESEDIIERFPNEKESDPTALRHLIELLQNRWTMLGERDTYDHGISKKTNTLGERAIVPEIQVVADNLTAVPEIKDLFDRYHFE